MKRIYISFMVIVVAGLLLLSCEKKNPIQLPELTTSEITDITEKSAVCGGTIISDGGAAIKERGVCWSTLQNPTTSDSKTADGTGTGKFISSINGLSASTTYFVRAYATNSAGIAYGNQVSFATNTAVTLPTLTTTAITSITTNSASSGGNITNDGGSPITEKGTCWSTLANPTVADSKTIDGTGSGSFSSNLTGLNESTIYYVRAYATNDAGTGYGDERTFTTLAPTVMDIEGNVYNTVLIGTQVWMSENLKTTKFADSTAIPNITDNTAWWNLTTASYCWYNNDSATYKENYGALYNFFAVADNRNICPAGWHVPTVDEWNTLITYLGGNDIAGGKMKETGNSHWATPNDGANNSSGFSGLPGGERYWNLFLNLGYYGYFWSTTIVDDEFAHSKTLSYGSADVGIIDNSAKPAGLSVRCVKN